MTGPPVMGLWWTDPLNPSKWRFSTFRVRAMFNGQPHLLKPNLDYPGWAAPEDVVKKLRNAAFYRKTTLSITPVPDGLGIWVKSEEDLTGLGQEASLMRRFEQAQGEIETLNRRVKELEEELSVLKTN